MFWGLFLMSGKFKIKGQASSDQTMPNCQQTYREVCLTFIDKITRETKIEKEKIIEFLKLMRINIASMYAKKFLIMVSLSDPEAIIDAIYTYKHNSSKYDHSSVHANIKRFLRYLINSKSKTIDLGGDIKIIDGVFDKVDDEISADELNRSIGVLEDELY